MPTAEASFGRLAPYISSGTNACVTISPKRTNQMPRRKGTPAPHLKRPSADQQNGDTPTPPASAPSHRPNSRPCRIVSLPRQETEPESVGVPRNTARFEYCLPVSLNRIFYRMRSIDDRVTIQPHTATNTARTTHLSRRHAHAILTAPRRPPGSTGTPRRKGCERHVRAPTPAAMPQPTARPRYPAAAQRQADVRPARRTPRQTDKTTGLPAAGPGTVRDLGVDARGRPHPLPGRDHPGPQDHIIIHELGI